MVSLALAPFGWGVAISVGLVIWTGVTAIFWFLSPKIEVTQKELLAGKFVIPRSVIGNVAGFDGEQARQIKGPKLSPAAALLLRGDIGPVVRIEIVDPQDPTPYLLLSSRRATELVSALS
ncbi:MAG: hypothetical protein RLZZ579_226 [Actinomycetota bacterium]|jgi:hypothetical protein